jgi:hypothetical protein
MQVLMEMRLAVFWRHLGLVASHHVTGRLRLLGRLIRASICRRGGINPDRDLGLSLFARGFAEEKGTVAKVADLYESTRMAVSPARNIATCIGADNSLGKNLAHFATTSGIRGHCQRSPLLDRRIVQFVLSLPPEMFVAGGWDRGLYRMAMKGLLPEKIRWRRDKQPFTPDYFRRVLASREGILDLLAGASRSALVRRYVNLKAITDQLAKVRRRGGWDAWECDTQRVVGFGVAVVAFLRWFETMTAQPPARG